MYSLADERVAGLMYARFPVSAQSLIYFIPFPPFDSVFNLQGHNTDQYGTSQYDSRVIRDMCKNPVKCARNRLYHHTLAGFIPILPTQSYVHHTLAGVTLRHIPDRLPAGILAGRQGIILRLLTYWALYHHWEPCRAGNICWTEGV